MFTFSIQAKDYKEFKESLAKLYKELEGDNTIEAQRSFELSTPEVKETKVAEAPNKKAKKKALGRPPKVATPEEIEKVKAQHDALVSRQAIHDALQQVNSTKGIAFAKAILEKFNAQRLSDLPEEKFSKFVEHCQNACMS